LDVHSILSLQFSSDEINKASAYLTETYYLSPSKRTRAGTDPAKAPFCFAFDTLDTQTGFFGWLEGEVEAKKSQSGVRDSAEGGYVLFPLHWCVG